MNMDLERVVRGFLGGVLLLMFSVGLVQIMALIISALT